MKNVKIITLIALLALISGPVLSQSKKQSAKKPASNWVKTGDWRKGLKLAPHPSINAAKFFKQYQADKTMWDKVFDYLRNTNLDTIAPGRYQIDGDKALAIISDAPSKELDKASWESHRKMIDLQYVIRGKERIDVAPIGKSTVTKPYDEAKDVANYTAEGTTYQAEPGTFYLFFAEDVHRPNIKVEGFDVVKKLVVKIKAN